MYDLNQPSDVIAQMREGEMTDKQIISVCEDVIEMLKATGKPILELGYLNGPEGNVFVVLGRAQKVAKNNKLDWDAINKEATSGDYEHVLETLREHFDVRYS